MAVVVPTVLAATPEEYTARLQRAEGVSSRVHVDICDGQFADTATIGLAQVQVGEGIALDLHLMLQDPVAQLETALSLKPSMIIFHAESDGDLGGAMNQIRQLGVRAGVAVLPQTPIESARELIIHADHVLIFTGTLGYNGGEFQPDQLSRVAEVRQIKPNVEVSVDGGVTDQNAALIALQGVDVLYSGAFIQDAADPQSAYDSIAHQAASNGAAV